MSYLADVALACTIIPFFGLSTVDRFLRGMAVGRAALAGEMRGVLHTPAENHIQNSWFLLDVHPHGFHKMGVGISQ